MPLQRFKGPGVKVMTDINHLSTSHGLIVVEEAGRGDLPVLLIHGNSLSREVFRKQLGGALSAGSIASLLSICLVTAIPAMP